MFADFKTTRLVASITVLQSSVRPLNSISSHVQQWRCSVIILTVQRCARGLFLELMLYVSSIYAQSLHASPSTSSLCWWQVVSHIAKGKPNKELPGCANIQSSLVKWQFFQRKTIIRKKLLREWDGKLRANFSGLGRICCKRERYEATEPVRLTSEDCIRQLIFILVQEWCVTCRNWVI